MIRFLPVIAISFCHILLRLRASRPVHPRSFWANPASAPSDKAKAPMVSGGRAKGQPQALRSSTVNSAVDFSKHNIQRSEDRSHVGQHVAASEKVHGL